METSRTTILSDDLPDSAADHRRLRPAEWLFTRMLRNIRGGSVELRFPSGARRVVGQPNFPRLRMTIHHRRFFRSVLRGGSVGFGESYVEGDWSTPDLTALLSLFARNRKKLGPIQRGFSIAARKANELYHRARENTIERSKANISEHYDLSNDFYATFLDSTMSYSSARFAKPGQDLEAAQAFKINRLLDLAGVSEGDHLLEIGSGWGALALAAARRGCRVTTVTLSVQQYDYALDLFEREGVADLVDIRLQDYRETEGAYDAVISCEMIEAVGKEYMRSYFDVLKRRVEPGGKVVLQAITIPHERYAAYANGCDWIQKHIFPGGHLPSPEIIRDHATEAGLTIGRTERFAHDYARTLRFWQERFNREKARVEELGFDERFRRKWNYYFSYCIAGFSNDLIGIRQMVLEPAP